MTILPGMPVNELVKWWIGLIRKFEHTTGASANPITQQLDPATGIFKYTRWKDSGLTYKVYYSTDLSNWTWDEFAVQSAGTAVNGVETVTVTLAAAAPYGGKLFVRVEAQ